MGQEPVPFCWTDGEMDGMLKLDHSLVRNSAATCWRRTCTIFRRVQDDPRLQTDLHQCRTLCRLSNVGNYVSYCKRKKKFWLGHRAAATQTRTGPKPSKLTILLPLIKSLPCAFSVSDFGASANNAFLQRWSNVRVQTAWWFVCVCVCVCVDGDKTTSLWIGCWILC